MRALLMLTALLMAAPPALAADVARCDDSRSNAWNLAEPWEANSALFANGAIRLAVVDTIEPAGTPFHLLVLSPPIDVLGGRQCRVVSAEGVNGFGGLDLSGAVASYDPARGLRVVIPAKTYLPDSGEFGPATLTVIINQATGAIDAELR